MKISTKERILRHAKERFLKSGFKKVSLDTLVDELKTSKSSLYNHFSSKEDLVKAVMERVNFEINSKLEKILNDDKLTFKGKMVAVTEFTGNLLSGVNEEFLSDLEVVTPYVWEYYLEERSNRINKYYSALFEKGIEEGYVRDDINLNLILAAYFNLTELPVKSGNALDLRMKNQNIYEDITEIFLNGIMK